MGDKQKTHRICEICGVRERHKSEKIFFATFPMKVDRCKEWLRVTGNQDLVQLPIEELHDTKKDFNKNGTRLKKRAIPNLYLTAPPLTPDHFAEFPQHIANDLSTREKELLQALQKAKSTIKSLKKSSLLIDKIQSPILKQIVEMACNANAEKLEMRSHYAILIVVSGILRFVLMRHKIC